jgi:hypothetical protein
MKSAYGMLLDRGLTLEQLELARRVSIADPDLRSNRRQLTVALRDLVSDQEAEGKTKKCLTRVWLSPPAEAAEMIAWARLFDCSSSVLPLVHFGAVLATFPFAGAVARVLGQHIQTDGRAEAAQVRSAVRRSLGDRSSVDVAARKAYTTFRNLGVVRQIGQVLEPAVDPINVPTSLGLWLSHAVLLTRQADSLPATSLRNAPELLGIQLPGASSREYPLIEAHSHVSGPVLARRAQVGRATA